MLPPSNKLKNSSLCDTSNNCCFGGKRGFRNNKWHSDKPNKKITSKQCYVLVGKRSVENSHGANTAAHSPQREDGEGWGDMRWEAVLFRNCLVFSNQIFSWDFLKKLSGQLHNIHCRLTQREGVTDFLTSTEAVLGVTVLSRFLCLGHGRSPNRIAPHPPSLLVSVYVLVLLQKSQLETARSALKFLASFSFHNQKNLWVLTCLCLCLTLFSYLSLSVFLSLFPPSSFPLPLPFFFVVLRIEFRTSDMLCNCSTP